MDVLKRGGVMLVEKLKQFRDAWEVALILIVAVLIFFAGHFYGASGNITKTEIKKLVKTQVTLAEDRITAQVQRNRLRIDKIEPPIQADNIEKIYQIQE